MEQSRYPKNLIPLCLLLVLKNHDAPEGLTRGQIRHFLSQDFGIEAEEKAIGRNLEVLRTFTQENIAEGFALQCVEKQRPSNVRSKVMRSNWRLELELPFDASEACLLADSVLSTEGLSSKMRTDLLEKLQSLCDEDIASMETTNPIPRAPINKELTSSINLINEAICNNRPISFVLGRYWPDKSLHEEDFDGQVREYRVWPVKLVNERGHRYCIAHFRDSNKLYSFRLDLMLHVSLEAIIANSDPAGEIDNQYSCDFGRNGADQQSWPLMMMEEPTRVKIRIDGRYLYELYAQFGTEKVYVSGINDGLSEATLDASPRALLIWSFQLAGLVEILEPAFLRNEAIKLAEKLFCIYRS